MLPELERLIRLQQLDNDTTYRRNWSSQLPALKAALDVRVATRRATLESARQALADNQAARRAIEKDLGAVQTRLSKYKDQLMEVKTNKEYLAMQHEIATAQENVRVFEDQILELLVQADEVGADVKNAETALKEEEEATTRERAALDAQERQVDQDLAALAGDRVGVAREVTPPLMKMYVQASHRHHGSAVVEARDGHCTACHTRLRPQFYNELRRGDRVVQCESCSRILFFKPSVAEPPALS